MTSCNKAKFLSQRRRRIGIAVASLLAFDCRVYAAAITITCTTENGMVPTSNGPLVITYDGEATGTLTVKGAFGDMALPATKQTRRGSVKGFNDDKEYEAVGIQADGPAAIVMPDKAVIEACVKGKPTPEGLTPEENVFMALMSCSASAPPGTAKVPITASVEIAFVSTAPPVLELMTTVMKQTYSEASTLPGGKITIETIPKCEIIQP